jgi:hypothetical protein
MSLEFMLSFNFSIANYKTGGTCANMKLQTNCHFVLKILDLHTPSVFDLLTLGENKYGGSNTG